MQKILEYIYMQEEKQREVLIFLHELLMERKLSVKMVYDLPFYYAKKRVCYLRATKENTVEIAFINGRDLSNKQGILNKKDRKMVSGIEFENVEQIPVCNLQEIIEEAIALED